MTHIAYISLKPAFVNRFFNDFSPFHHCTLQFDDQRMAEVECQTAPFGSIKRTAAVVACLVTMATHGRSGLSRLAFGSVAEKVLQGLSCPLFLVRPG